MRTQRSAAVTEWRSTGSGFTPNTYVDTSVDSGWSVAATGDFNDDGRADILFRNANSAFTIGESNGDGFVRDTLTDVSVHTDWTVVTHHYDIV